MFKHILVTLDGSPYSERVLSYVADLAMPAQAQVTLLTVIPEDSSPLGGETPAPDSARLQLYQSYLDRHATPLREAGLADVRTEVGSGTPARAIVDTARRLGVDLIVMGTQGVSAQTDQGLGGVASKVLASAPCPMFMVRVLRPQPPRTPAEERWQAEGGGNVG